MKSERTFLSGRPIQVVCERIVRDFEHGTRLRQLGIVYEMRVEALEGILRDRLRSLESAMRTAGVAVAILAGFAVGIEACEAAWGMGGVEQIRVVRVRSRRSRRGRDEAAVSEMAEFAQARVRVTFGEVAA